MSKVIIDESLSFTKRPLAIFCYGTLMRGESRYQDLKNVATPRFVWTAAGRGRLVDCGDYPGLLPEGEGWVQGDFMVFAEKDMSKVLDHLDMIEGCDSGLFVRRVETFGVGDKEREAWVYLFNKATGDEAVIESGDWREHRGRRSAFFERLAEGYATAGGGIEALLGKVAENSIIFTDHAKWIQERMDLAQALMDGRIDERELGLATDSPLID